MSYLFVDTQPALTQAIEELSGEAIVAVDLECDNNLHHYGTRVCLIQLASERRVFIVDTLAAIDLTPVFDLFLDERIEKVMHDTDFDLRCLAGQYGVHPRNLFDTVIAARLAGHRSFGMAPLLKHFFGIVQSKQYQRADWNRRPLSQPMLAYAAGDVSHLVQLRHLLSRELESLGRFAWAREEFARCERSPEVEEAGPVFWRVKGAGNLRGRALAVLAALADEREAIARELDLPPFKVVTHEMLLALAQKPSHRVEELGHKRGLHPYLRHEGAARFQAAIDRGLVSEIPKWPRSRAGRIHAQEDKALLTHLKEWRVAYAKELNLEPDVVISQRVLRRIAEGMTFAEAVSSDEVRHWQREAIIPILERVVRQWGSGKGKK